MEILQIPRHNIWSARPTDPTGGPSPGDHIAQDSGAGPCRHRIDRIGLCSCLPRLNRTVSQRLQELETLATGQVTDAEYAASARRSWPTLAVLGARADGEVPDLPGVRLRPPVWWRGGRCGPGMGMGVMTRSRNAGGASPVTGVARGALTRSAGPARPLTSSCPDICAPVRRPFRMSRRRWRTSRDGQARRGTGPDGVGTPGRCS